MFIRCKISSKIMFYNFAFTRDYGSWKYEKCYKVYYTVDGVCRKMSRFQIIFLYDLRSILSDRYQWGEDVNSERVHTFFVDLIHCRNCTFINPFIIRFYLKHYYSCDGLHFNRFVHRLGHLFSRWQLQCFKKTMISY